MGFEVWTARGQSDRKLQGRRYAGQPEPTTQLRGVGRVTGSLEEFAQVYRAQRNSSATDAEVKEQYELFKGYAKGFNTVETPSGIMTRDQLKEKLGGQHSAKEIDWLADGLLNEQERARHYEVDTKPYEVNVEGRLDNISGKTYTESEEVTDGGEEVHLRNGGQWDKKGKVSKELTTTGWVLYDNAANSGDTKLALDILDQMARHQRNAAQALQATRILKKLSSENQLYHVQQSVQNLQEELNEKYGKGKKVELKVDQELADQLMAAGTQEERDEILKDIYRDIGRQMPSRFVDKCNAWRYLAMLGNPRTHVRNVLGNAGFAPVVAVKNLTATGIERSTQADRMTTYTKGTVAK